MQSLRQMSHALRARARLRHARWPRGMRVLLAVMTQFDAWSPCRRRARENMMRPLLALSNAIDWLNQKLGNVCNFLVLAACVVSAGNAMIRYAFGYSSNSLARNAVVHVRRLRDVRRLLHLQAQRACPRRNPLSDAVRARPALARPDRDAVLPDPVLPAAHLSVVAVLLPVLCGRRNLQQCRRPDPLADQDRRSRRLRPAGAARRLRGDQAHRRAEGLCHDRCEVREAAQ